MVASNNSGGVEEYIMNYLCTKNQVTIEYDMGISEAIGTPRTTR